MYLRMWILWILAAGIVVLIQASPIDRKNDFFEDYDAIPLARDELLPRTKRHGWFTDDYGNYLWEDEDGNISNTVNGNNNNYGGSNNNGGSNFGNGNNNSGDNNGNTVIINCNPNRNWSRPQYDLTGNCV